MELSTIYMLNRSLGNILFCRSSIAHRIRAHCGALGQIIKQSSVQTAVTIHFSLFLKDVDAAAHALGVQQRAAAEPTEGSSAAADGGS